MLHQLLLLTLASAALSASVTDEAVSRAVNRAEAILEAEDRAKMVDGVSIPITRRKVTESSRAMSHRNRIFRRSVNLLKAEEGLREEEAAQAMDRLDIRALIGAIIRRGRPGGTRGRQTRPVRIHDVSCADEDDRKCLGKHFWQRSIDGTCNNVVHTTWGSVGTFLRRNASALYHGGSRDVPRGGYSSLQKRNRTPMDVDFTDGKDEEGECEACPGLLSFPELPDSRQVSDKFHVHSDIPAPFTHLLTIFGQFLDHDISISAEEEVEDCCEHPDSEGCFPMPVSERDSFFGEKLHNKTCLDFSRSVAYCEGKTEQREQMNEITAFVDASNVYGSDDDEARSLRKLWGGLLKTDEHDLLPVDPSGETTVRVAGDVRSGENPALASMHNLWLREHNRIARLLAQFNPPNKVLSEEAQDEELYQRARVAVIGQMQNIVYDGFLPIILGEETMRAKNLNLDIDVPYSGQVDPSVVNGFSTAAYRFGHSLVNGNFKLFGIKKQWENEVVDHYDISENFFKEDEYLKGNGLAMQQILKGLTKQAAQKNDRFIDEQLTHKLFADDGSAFGTDLIARNIHRARDHGLPGYNAYRRLCGLRPLCSWDHKPAEINWTNWNLLKDIYSDTTAPGDIDLFPAGLAEIPVTGGISGKTFNCIKANQFASLRQGDRFFFMNKGLKTSLSHAQMHNLRSRTIRDVLCDNTDIENVQVNAFLAADNKGNPMKSCSHVNAIDCKIF